MRRNVFLPLLLILIISCTLPASGVTAPASIHAPTGPVQILSPQNGATLPGSPMQVAFSASGGPFIEADLVIDGNVVGTLAQDGTSASVSGTLTWTAPTGGPHTLMVQEVTNNKEVLSGSIQITVQGVSAGSPGATPPALQPPAQAGGAPGSAFLQDPGYAAARQRIRQILQDKYQLDMAAPPIGRKYRTGVTTDPWVTAIYYQNWIIEIALYPDGREAAHAYPLNSSAPAGPNYLGPGDKPIATCRPSGTIRMLIVFVDYGNLGVTQSEAFDTLNRVGSRLNTVYSEVSRAGGVSTPILQLQITGAFMSPPPDMPELLLTPDIIRAHTSFDPAQFDLLVQVDLDSAETYRHRILIPAGQDTYGFANGGCGALSNTVNIWMSLATKEQADGVDSETRLQSTLAHEFLHNAGYPIGLTGLHEWPCGDGSVQDGSDECADMNLPTLMLGWVDIDGDGVVEILDRTPYGLGQP
jgi:hypothetical protein